MQTVRKPTQFYASDLFNDAVNSETTQRQMVIRLLSRWFLGRLILRF
jgi:hypothetical protein